MAYKTEYSQRAEYEQDRIEARLREEFGDQVADRFLNDIEKRLDAIEQFPRMCKAVQAIDELTRRSVIHRNTSMYYRIDDDKQLIRILTFFDNRRHPDSLKF